MPYLTTYVSAKEMFVVEAFCLKNNITSYQLTKEAVLEKVKKK
jgi:hypothetical protein